MSSPAPDVDVLELRLSKHFRNTWMRKWDWDVRDLRTALKEAYRVDKAGKTKYEAYTKYKGRGKSRKIVFVAYENERLLYVITGTEGS